MTEEFIRSSVVPTIQLIELKEAVARIETGVENLVEKQLPPVAKDAKQAREGVIKLTGWNRDMSRRLTKVEENPPTHPCTQEDRIVDHGNSITAHEKQIAGLGKGRAIAITVGIFAVGLVLSFAGKSIYDSASASTNISNIQRDVSRHEAMIKSMEENRQRDRMAITTQIGKVPDKVKAAISVGDTKSLDDLPHAELLTARERQHIEFYLERAKVRGDG